MPSVERGIQLKKNSQKPLRVLFTNKTRSWELGSPEQYQAFLKVLPVFLELQDISDTREAIILWIRALYSNKQANMNPVNSNTRPYVL